MAREPDGSGAPPGNSAPGADPRVRRRDLRRQRRQRRVRDRRRLGAILWKYTANVDAERRAAVLRPGEPRRRARRRQSLRRPARRKLVALDQRTGKVAWSIQAEAPKLGFTITSAPLYYDGMVITGFAGGDCGTRGRVKAFDAKNGKLRWTFYTVPGPGEIGHDTWPQDNDVWNYGGAPVWQTPAVDPELGLIYFSTGNPGPTSTAASRAGDNLFSVSIVAIDATTGKYRWHFQQVHHDIWDYDSPNPVILFDAHVRRHDAQGARRRSRRRAGSTSSTARPASRYRHRGEARDAGAAAATAATQPFPIGDAIVPQSIDMPPEGLRARSTTARSSRRSGRPADAREAARGGANWPPSSYDPATHTMYICATDRSGARRRRRSGLIPPSRARSTRRQLRRARMRRRARHLRGARRHDE